MKKCPKCSRLYDDSWAVCLRCDSELAAYEGAAGAGGAPAEKGRKRELKKYYQNVFAKFDAGRPPISWNWFAAIFQLVWYACKGMWPKAVLYGMIWWGVGYVLVLAEVPFAGPLLWMAWLFYFGAVSNYDYYMYKRRGELLWPRLSYKKVKIIFWAAIVGIALYAAFSYGAAVARAVAVLAREARPEEARSYTGGGMRFSALPGQWRIVTDPPVPFTLKISRPALNDALEALACSSVPGTRFMGYIAEGWQGTAIYKGMVSLTVKKPFIGRRYDSIKEGILVKKAMGLAGQEKMSFMAQLLNPRVTVTPVGLRTEYLSFAGQEWGCARSELQMNFGGVKKKVFRNVYWTLVKGSAVYVVTESFEPYKDEVKAQAEGFLNSGSYETSAH